MGYSLGSCGRVFAGAVGVSALVAANGTALLESCGADADRSVSRHLTGRTATALHCAGNRYGPSEWLFAIKGLTMGLWKGGVQYGPPKPHKISLLEAQTGFDRWQKKFYEFAVDFFNIISWSVATSLVDIIWQNTGFGLFLIITLLMAFTIVIYIAITIAKYIILFVNSIFKNVDLEGSLRNFSIMALTLCVPLGLSVYYTNHLIGSGLKRLIRVQICSIYHWNSSDIPQECRKFVQLRTSKTQ